MTGRHERHPDTGFHVGSGREQRGVHRDHLDWVLEHELTSSAPEAETASDLICPTHHVCGFTIAFVVNELWRPARPCRLTGGPDTASTRLRTRATLARKYLPISSVKSHESVGGSRGGGVSPPWLRLRIAPDRRARRHTHGETRTSAPRLASRSCHRRLLRRRLCYPVWGGPRTGHLNRLC
jgi:hypothetical protein